MKKSPNWRYRILVFDAVWVVLAMSLAYLLRYGWTWNGPEEGTAMVFSGPLVVFLALWTGLSLWQRMDGFRGGWRFAAVVSHIMLGIATVMSCLLAAGYLARVYISRLALAYFGVLLFLGFLAIRFMARRSLWSRQRGGHLKRVVVIGNGHLAAEIAKKIERHPEIGWQVAGYLSPEDASADVVLLERSSGVAHLSDIEVMNIFRSHKVQEIIVALPKSGHPALLEFTTRCLQAGIGVNVVPQPYELYLSTPSLFDVDGLPLLQLYPPTSKRTDPVWKRPFDLLGSILLMPLAAPLVCLAALILKLGKGRAFSREYRCGLNGEPFFMYRLNSPRLVEGLSAIDAILQQLSITELPQLWNVLCGDMSLVGPRPEGPDRAHHYTEWQIQRLRVRPGLTGLAQVHGLRYQHPSEDKTYYDLQYILHMSLFQDVSLLVQTTWTLIERCLHIGQGQRMSPSIQVVR